MENKRLHNQSKAQSAEAGFSKDLMGLSRTPSANKIKERSKRADNEKIITQALLTYKSKFPSTLESASLNHFKAAIADIMPSETNMAIRNLLINAFEIDAFSRLKNPPSGNMEIEMLKLANEITTKYAVQDMAANGVTDCIAAIYNYKKPVTCDKVDDETRYENELVGRWESNEGHWFVFESNGQYECGGGPNLRSGTYQKLGNELHLYVISSGSTTTFTMVITSISIPN